MAICVSVCPKNHLTEVIVKIKSRPSIHGESSARDDGANSLKNCHHGQVLTRLSKEMGQLHFQDNVNLLVKKMVLMLGGIMPCF